MDNLNAHYEHFIDTIKDYIAGNELNLTTFAQILGVRESCVSQWLSGNNKPSLEYVILIADKLNLSCDYLFWLTTNPEFTPAKSRTNFAERLQTLLRDNHLSKNKLAAICGVTSSTVSKWLLRGQLPKPQVAINISKYFGCSLDYLLGRE